MPDNFNMLLAIGVLAILFLLLAVIVVIWRGSPEPAKTYPKMSTRDEQQMLFYMDDGIGEIFAGLIIFMFGMSLLSEMVWMAGVFVAIFTPLYINAKRSYTAPRLHFLEDTPPSRGGFSVIIIAFLLLGILTLVIGVMLFGAFQTSNLPLLIQDLLNDYGWALAGGFAVLVWLIAAYITEVPRFYGYAVFFSITLSIGLLAGFQLPLLIAGSGAFVFGIGLLLLYRFVSHKPVAFKS